MTPLETLRCGPGIPAIGIVRLQDAVPLTAPSVAGGVGFLKVTLRTPVALQAIEAIAHDVDAAIVGRGRF